jgi:putative flippase GtrA
VSDDYSTTLELPRTGEFPVVPAVPAVALTPLQRTLEAVRHPENHKQAVRFLCVGASGYVVNTITFAVCVHALSMWDTAAFVVAFLTGTANNFWWNRNWTFDATHHHIGRQGVRFLLVSALVAACAFGVYQLIISATGMDRVLAEALAYIVVTPLSFVVQKLWSFKA